MNSIVGTIKNIDVASKQMVYKSFHSSTAHQLSENMPGLLE